MLFEIFVFFQLGGRTFRDFYRDRHGKTPGPVRPCADFNSLQAAKFSCGEALLAGILSLRDLKFIRIFYPSQVFIAKM